MLSPISVPVSLTSKHHTPSIVNLITNQPGLSRPTNSGTPGRCQDLTPLGLAPLDFISDIATDSHVLVAVSSGSYNNSHRLLRDSKIDNAEKAGAAVGEIAGGEGVGGRLGSGGGGAHGGSGRRVVVAFRGSSTTTHWVQNLR